MGTRGRRITESSTLVTATAEKEEQDIPDDLLVLVVEDEEPIAEALALLVLDAGYTPLIASHGRQALELARKRLPALVITDLMMPYLDGAGLITALRADAANAERQAPPIILMTAAGLQRVREVGADAVLSKPFDLDEVEALLARFLGPALDHESR